MIQIYCKLLDIKVLACNMTVMVERAYGLVSYISKSRHYKIMSGVGSFSYKVLLRSKYSIKTL